MASAICSATLIWVATLSVVLFCEIAASSVDKPLRGRQLKLASSRSLAAADCDATPNAPICNPSEPSSAPPPPIPPVYFAVTGAIDYNEAVTKCQTSCATAAPGRAKCHVAGFTSLTQQNDVIKSLVNSGKVSQGYWWIGLGWVVSASDPAGHWYWDYSQKPTTFFDWNTASGVAWPLTTYSSRNRVSAFVDTEPCLWYRGCEVYKDVSWVNYAATDPTQKLFTSGAICMGI